MWPSRRLYFLAATPLVIIRCFFLAALCEKISRAMLIQTIEPIDARLVLFTLVAGKGLSKASEMD